MALWQIFCIIIDIKSEEGEDKLDRNTRIKTKTV